MFLPDKEHPYKNLSPTWLQLRVVGAVPDGCARLRAVHDGTVGRVLPGVNSCHHPFGRLVPCCV